MSGDAPTPVAQGTLEKAPFAQLVLFIYNRRLDGTLAVWPDRRDIDAGATGQDRVRVRHGRPVAARLREPRSVLDLSLLPLFARRDAPYAFYKEDLVGEGEGTVHGRVDPHRLIAAGLRGNPREDIMDSVLQALGEHKLRILPHVKEDVFDLQPNERSVIELMRAAPASVHELGPMSGQDPRLVRRIVYLLHLVRGLELLDPETARRISESQESHPVRRNTEQILRDLVRHARQSRGVDRPSTPHAGVRRPDPTEGEDG